MAVAIGTGFYLLCLLSAAADVVGGAAVLAGGPRVTMARVTSSMRRPV